MALIKCEECKKEYSDTLDACPHCGFKIKKEDNFYSYLNLADDAYDYAKDTGLLDFSKYNSGMYSDKSSYSKALDSGDTFMSTTILTLNTIANKKEYNYNGLKLLIPIYDEYYKGTFCLGICEDRVLYFHTKKMGIKIVEYLRETLDVSSTSFSKIELNVTPNKNGDIREGFLLLDGKFAYKVIGYDPVMLWYLSYCIENINNKEFNLKYKSGTIKQKKFNEEEIQASKSSGGCYVATCAYESYDCPQVWVLRRYRDYELANTWYGRQFIKTYYFVSPKIVKLFGNKKWFKNFFKTRLDKKVNLLKSKGFSDAPYEDIKW